MRVDFYLLERGDPLVVTTRLAARAWPEFRPLVITGSEQTLAKLDERLWREPGGRFLPHGIEDERAPIRLQTTRPTTATAWINLADGRDIPTGPFRRVLEIVSADEASRSAARRRYKAWRDQGAEINHHKMK